MRIFDRRRQTALDQLVAEYSVQDISRRAFFQRALALGLSMSMASELLISCEAKPSPSSPQVVEVLNVWGTDEQAAFNKVIHPFTQQHNITVKIEATRDLDAALSTLIQNNQPPDIAILPNPGKMQELVRQHKLVPLDTFLDMEQIRREYSPFWLDIGSDQGVLYALFFKVANIATIWYSPVHFQSISASIPTTWTELIKLSDNIAQHNQYPWSMGVKSGAASGWPAADWIAEIYLNLYGPDLYDQWVLHQIPWTHKSLKDAFQMYRQILNGKHYIKDAPQSILDTGFQESCYPPFETPPQASMFYLGDFAATFIANQFKHAKAGTDYNFFPFPSIEPRYSGSVTCGADVVVAMKNNDAVGALVRYLATAQAQSIWVQLGGFTSANTSVDPSAYPNTVARTSARMISDATRKPTGTPIIRFGAGDRMPPAVQRAFWRGMLTFISGQSDLESILRRIEAVAQQSY